MIELRELLELLGDDADAIAVFLIQHGFHGWRGVGEECPLANYLKLNGVAEPAVDAQTLTYLHEGCFVTLELPDAVQDFVMLFDDGAYPELETYRTITEP